MPRGTSTSQIRRRTRRAAARAAEGPGSALVAAASLRDLRESLVAAGDAERPLVTTYDLAHGSPAERFFHKEALEAGWEELDGDWWPTEDATLHVTDATAFRVGDREQVLRLPDGTLALVYSGGGSVGVRTAGPSGRDAIAALRELYPPAYLTVEADQRVPITFWMMGSLGPTQRLRRIEAQPWGDVERNYSGEVRSELERVMAWRNGDDADGQLLLWQGLPGTGKTWALRALADAWAPWAEFHYITDPDVFFGQRSSYMVDVLLSDSYGMIDQASGDIVDEERPGSKWKVLILEDTGDLLAANARDSYGAGLSRLLNVVDGMIGQGLRVLALVTTNDQLDDLHPAVTRPGRCAQQLEFGPLPADEAAAWLGEDAVDEPMTLAELYARAGAARPAELAMEQCADCGHAFSAHMGSSGPCTMEDCSCKSYAEPEPDADDKAALEAAGPRPLAEAFVRIRPDMTDFEAHVRERILAAYEQAESDLLEGLGEHAETVRMRLRELRLLPHATDSVPLPPEHQPGARVPRARRGPSVPAPPATPDEGNGPANAAIVKWQAILCPEGAPTDDGRVFAPGSIEWRELPLSLMAMIETQAGHDGAQVSGRIDRIWRDGANIMGEGVFDTGDFGQEIARMVGDGTLRGVSVDIAILAMEVTYRSNVLGADGEWIAKPDDVEETDDDKGLDPPLLEQKDDDQLMLVVWRGKIGAATVCPFPAFAEANIELAELQAGGPPNPLHWRYRHEGDWAITIRPPSLAERALTASTMPAVDAPREGVEVPPDGTTALVAGADDVPMRPPAEWFADPALDGPTPMTVDDDGRIYGHAATWGVCHIGIPGACTTAPRSATSYAYFHLKEVELDDGRRVGVGTITMDTGHAGKGLGRAAATRHYDDTGTAVAQVRVGEDEHGIWFAGAAMAGLDDESFRMLRGAVLSGDWRNVDGNLELVALLCVNVPGFPVPRGPEAAIVASGGHLVVESLVAAGLGEERVTAADRERLAALLMYDEFADLAAELPAA